MTRFYLTYALLFAVPFVLYVSYIYFSMGRSAIRESLTVKALGWLSVLGAGLTVVVIVVLTNFTGFASDGVYQPARFEDGRLLPGTIVEPDAPSPE
ncbi:DUF6111 family protein [Pararhizobium sp. IMCC21322]|uniref:DUF6111 family protein n=1 Tax=Pararhizobium sp. IMCC21322 TaxID=3067903 RepID=UPI0027403687|nr:DUF6111 family protein [Pararhizobium sp. IMCC21322]